MIFLFVVVTGEGFHPTTLSFFVCKHSRQFIFKFSKIYSLVTNWKGSIHCIRSLKLHVSKPNHFSVVVQLSDNSLTTKVFILALDFVILCIRQTLHVNLFWNSRKFTHACTSNKLKRQHSIYVVLNYMYQSNHFLAVVQHSDNLLATIRFSY